MLEVLSSRVPGSAGADDSCDESAPEFRVFPSGAGFWEGLRDTPPTYPSVAGHLLQQQRALLLSASRLCRGALLALNERAHNDAELLQQLARPGIRPGRDKLFFYSTLGAAKAGQHGRILF